jgi:hypothetical protein
MKFAIPRLTTTTTTIKTLKKTLVRRIIWTSYEFLLAIPTTPRIRVPDRDMGIDERTPPRASDIKSIGMING